MPFNNMRDEELVDELALYLSDFEFELLVRERIKRAFNQHLVMNHNLDETQSYCTFKYDWHDKCEWNICLGGSYRDRVDTKGEVLSITLDDCHEMWKRQNKNKLSLLLPG